MKIKNGRIYFSLLQRGKKGWGDKFEQYVKGLIESLEQEMSQGKILDSNLILITSHKIQIEKLKLLLNEEMKKEAFNLLVEAWEHGDKIKEMMVKGKL